MPLPTRGAKVPPQYPQTKEDHWDDDSAVDYTAADYAKQTHDLVRPDTSDIDASDPYEYADDANTFYATSDEIAAAPSGHLGQTFEQAHPGEVFTKQADRCLRDRFQTWVIPATPAGTVGTPIPIAAHNVNREYLRLFTDAGNAGPVMVSDEPTGVTGGGGSAILLASGSGVLKLQGKGTVFIQNMNATAVTIYVIYGELR